MVLNAAGTRLYVVNTESGSVSVIDTGTRTVIGTIRLNCRPFAADLNASEDQLVVICHNNNNVALADTGTLQMTGTVPVGPSPIATGRFIAATSAPRLPDVLTGLWWNPAEPGWGVHVSHRGNRMFAAWFTYDGSGRPKWYVSSDCVMNSQLPTPPAQGEATCTGSVYETTGPRFFSDPYNPGGVSVTRLGLFQMGFSDRDKGAMSVVIGTTAKTVALRRQAFASGNLPATDYTDLWWNPSESGWGIGITQQASTMFVAWFAYDDTGTAQWYVASNCAVNAPGNGCAGALYRTSGPIDPLRNAFDPSRVKVTAVGSIAVSFTDANTGSISYEVDGKAGTKSITRQPF
jgi:YVTN family beta-propeller protein